LKGSTTNDIVGTPDGEGKKIAEIFGKLSVPMKNQGKIESAILEAIGHFEQEYMGRGPIPSRAPARARFATTGAPQPTHGNESVY
jgi:hypothetical protein